VVAGPIRLLALPRLTRRGSGGKDRWKSGIGPAGSDRNELLPLNLQVQGSWPSRCGSCQSGASPGTKKILVPTCSVICGTTPVDVKQNSGRKTERLVEKAKLAGEKQEKTGKKP
jgi:hypothetical protein